MNTVNLVGRLGKDPEKIETKSGKQIVKFSIATNDGYGDNKKTNWHNCVCFGKTGEIIAKYVSKGDNLAVSGTLDYNKHEDKIYTSVLVNSFTFVGNNQSDKLQEAKEKIKPLIGEDNDQSDLPF